MTKIVTLASSSKPIKRIAPEKTTVGGAFIYIDKTISLCFGMMIDCDSALAPLDLYLSRSANGTIGGLDPCVDDGIIRCRPVRNVLAGGKTHSRSLDCCVSAGSQM
jgi:hypothetical protein